MLTFVHTADEMEVVHRMRDHVVAVGHQSKDSSAASVCVSPLSHAGAGSSSPLFEGSIVRQTPGSSFGRRSSSVIADINEYLLPRPGCKLGTHSQARAG